MGRMADWLATKALIMRSSPESLQISVHRSLARLVLYLRRLLGYSFREQLIRASLEPSTEDRVSRLMALWIGGFCSKCVLLAEAADSEAIVGRRVELS